MKSYLQNLNNEQYEAATTIDGEVFILAGAGSGKTTTLVARVAYLLDEGIPGDEILLLTFTNKAAREMKNRIISLIGEKAKDVTASTFHSFCANFIRRNARLLDLSPDYTILDSPDMLDAIGIVKQEFLSKAKKEGKNYGLSDFPKTAVIGRVYENAVNNCTTYEKICNLLPDCDVYKSEICEILEGFAKYKKERNFLDYNDLLFWTEKLLSNDEFLRKKVDEQYKYISCDEYQDTNTIQNRILELMSKDYKNLAVVGDDNQSIYAFRSANINNILNFDKTHPNCKTIVLNQNYRSSQEILDTANTMMTYATEGKEKYLKGMFHGNKPKLIVKEDCNEEADYIVEKIKQRNTDLSDIAVICRSARQTFILEQKLNLAGIPFNKFGGLKFMERVIIKDLLAFLRILVNEKDELAWFRILQLYPGIGKTYANKISKIIISDNIDEAIKKYKKRAFATFLEEVKTTFLNLSSMEFEKQMDFLVETYYKEVVSRNIKNRAITDSQKSEELHILNESMADAEILKEMTSKYRSASRFLSDIVLDATIDENSEDRLNITTIHSAKGLEYDTVFIMDCVEGVTPRCINSASEDSEELRCMYVAVTRAKKELYFMIPKYYGFKHMETTLSHFINKTDILNTMQRNVSNEELERLCEVHRFGF